MSRYRLELCGEGGRCAEDDEGRPLFHSGATP